MSCKQGHSADRPAEAQTAVPCLWQIVSHVYCSCMQNLISALWLGAFYDIRKAKCSKSRLGLQNPQPEAATPQLTAGKALKA